MAVWLDTRSEEKRKEGEVIRVLFSMVALNRPCDSRMQQEYRCGIDWAGVFSLSGV